MNMDIKQGGTYQVSVSATGIFRQLGTHAALETEVLFGELVEVLELAGEYVRARALLDGYEGYVAKGDLRSPFAEPTHRVNMPKVVAYSGPSFKQLKAACLYMNSRVRVVRTQETTEGKMAQIQGCGWVFSDQLVPIYQHVSNASAEAVKFVGTPYLWGGRSSSLDCSALIQAACIAAGIPCPRDCVPQSRELGEAVAYEPGDPLPPLERDYLVFWTEDKGRHVAIMLDGTNCVHATIAWPHRKTLIQPITELIADQARDGNGGVTCIRRLPTALAL